MLRGQLVSDFKRDKSLGWLKRLIISHMWYNKISQPDFVSYDIRALPCRRATKIRQQVPVLGWTIRSEAEFERVKLENNLDRNQSQQLLSAIEKAISPKTIKQMIKSGDPEKYAADLIEPLCSHCR